MSELANHNPEIVAQYSPEAYDQTVDLAERWLPRLGGYEYKINEELPKDESGIITPKHTGMIDIPLVGVTVRSAYGRQARFVGKRQLFDLPIVGDRVGNFFYERGGIRLDREVRLANQPARQQIDQAIEDDELVVLFGEGTRIRSFHVDKVKKGMAQLAMKHNVPIQTVGIAGTHGFYGRKFLVFGRLFWPDLDKFDGQDERSKIRYGKELTEQVRGGMQEATDEAFRMRDRMQVHIPFFPDRH